MKKILSYTLTSLLCFQIAYADLTVKPNSFQCLQDKNRASGTDMGVQNMTMEALGDLWMRDVDGLMTTAMLVVFFENMSEDDMKDLKVALSTTNEAQTTNEVVESDYKPSRRFFIPESNEAFDIDFLHKRAGNVRYHVPKMERGKTYQITLQASGMTPITITTNPPGATIIFDGQEYPDKSNTTIPDVTVGKHTLALRYPSNSPGESLSNQEIEVTPTKNSFNYDRLRSKTISLIAQPKGSEIMLIDNEGSIVKGWTGYIHENLKYGVYKIKGRMKGEEMETDFTVNNMTDEINEISVKPSKAVTILATQYNNKVNNATVHIDGVNAGTTPLTYNLFYGEHTITVSSNGYTQSKTIKVNRNSDYEIILKLPTRSWRKRWNPFDIDYEAYDWGMAFHYINRSYRWTEKGFPNAYTDFFGQEKHNHGASIDILYQHTFKYGQGLRTGLNFQMMFGTIDVDDEPELHTDFTMQIPIEYQFRLPLSRTCSFFVHGGVGLNIGLVSSIDLDNDESINVGYGYNSEYDMILPRRFDCTWIVGGGFQVKHVQFEAKFERGLRDNAPLLKKYGGVDISGLTWHRQMWTVGMSFIW